MNLRTTLSAIVFAIAASLAAGPDALAQTPPAGGGTGGSAPGSTGGNAPATTERHKRGTEIDLPIGMPFTDLEIEDPPDPPTEDDVTKLYDEEIEIKNESIIYVIDISGSMDWDTRSYTGLDGQSRRGNRLDRAKVELIRSIQGLRPNFEFNIIAFDCDIRRWSGSKQKAEPGPKAAATGWVNNLRPIGATGTGPATASALGDKSNFTVVLLSDGAPNCGANSDEGHRRMISQANSQRAVVHTFGIACYGSFERFMRNIASDSGGTYTSVP